MILCFLLFVLMFAVPMSVGIFRSFMTVLNKKKYEGLSVQKAKVRLWLFIPCLLVLVGSSLFILFVPNSEQSHSSFEHFLGVAVQEDITLLYDEDNSHDEFKLYRVCFRAKPSTIEKIIAHNGFVPEKESLAINTVILKCVGDQESLYQYTKPKNEKNLFSQHKEKLFYNETTQVAWYMLEAGP